ncbi:four-carbon acid sugar kinase family protein [Bogoriella caseilytica]|uniref:Uncharacterized protein YgbK (DUF1537 family) n=1 Tax=Bogoriella caseilytica TaxID=56055 RepID=A0A3N2BB15_9MICO|nr:four-carbon acid sugar kinase family protein [Bogoriella caseilytica]ROR72418.1 uncharacterized protein YgbK (DUF1537 family) [Bogoriella caseilytica]
MAEQLVAYYGDDLTGSIDVLLQFSRAGHAGRLFLGLPEPAELRATAGQVGVVGIAGIARSLATADLESEVAPALRALAAVQPAVLQYKACSTIDSSPRIGSLGRVLEIGRSLLGEGAVPMLFAQPDFGRYTVFGHHFAAEDGVVHRLDRQPTMSAHPVTPMDESDIARHLARQTELPLASLPLTHYTDPVAVRSEVDRTTAAAVVLDALREDDLRLLGEAFWHLAEARRPLFTMGSGGLSAALARTMIAPPTRHEAPGPERAGGAVLAVSGSRSARTAAQIEHARASGWTVLPLPLRGAPDRLAEMNALLGQGRSVVLTVGEQTLPGGPEAALAAIARAAAMAVEHATTAGMTRRVIICGGDTSGRVLRALAITSVEIVDTVVANVVTCAARAHRAELDGVEFTLKGGQMGPAELFALIDGA